MPLNTSTETKNENNIDTDGRVLDYLRYLFSTNFSQLSIGKTLQNLVRLQKFFDGNLIKNIGCTRSDYHVLAFVFLWPLFNTKEQQNIIKNLNNHIKAKELAMDPFEAAVFDRLTSFIAWEIFFPHKDKKPFFTIEVPNGFLQKTPNKVNQQWQQLFKHVIQYAEDNCPKISVITYLGESVTFKKPFNVNGPILTKSVTIYQTSKEKQNNPITPLELTNTSANNSEALIPSAMLCERLATLLTDVIGKKPKTSLKGTFNLGSDRCIAPDKTAYEESFGDFTLLLQAIVTPCNHGRSPTTTAKIRLNILTTGNTLTFKKDHETETSIYDAYKGAGLPGSDTPIESVLLKLDTSAELNKMGTRVVQKQEVEFSESRGWALEPNTELKNFNYEIIATLTAKKQLTVQYPKTGVVVVFPQTDKSNKPRPVDDKLGTGEVILSIPLTDDGQTLAILLTPPAATPGIQKSAQLNQSRLFTTCPSSSQNTAVKTPKTESRCCVM